jgi:hypothetical protein
MKKAKLLEFSLYSTELKIPHTIHQSQLFCMAYLLVLFMQIVFLGVGGVE